MSATGQKSFRQVTFAFLGIGAMLVCLKQRYYRLGQGEVENVIHMDLFVIVNLFKQFDHLSY